MDCYSESKYKNLNWLKHSKYNNQRWILFTNFREFQNNISSILNSILGDLALLHGAI